MSLGEKYVKLFEFNLAMACSNRFSFSFYANANNTLTINNKGSGIFVSPRFDLILESFTKEFSLILQLFQTFLSSGLLVRTGSVGVSFIIWMACGLLSLLGESN